MGVCESRSFVHPKGRKSTAALVDIFGREAGGLGVCIPGHAASSDRRSTHWKPGASTHTGQLSKLDSNAPHDHESASASQTSSSLKEYVARAEYLIGQASSGGNSWTS
eukprot:1777314-Amphidinium_carterae.1